MLGQVLDNKRHGLPDTGKHDDVNERLFPVGSVDPKFSIGEANARYFLPGEELRAREHIFRCYALNADPGLSANCVSA